ncbi:hypothetical protein E2C01_088261 [Portunus trituberculatus]|uniref:Uncharacterized protein n=1 Tax=Portunus trituberculatus TaxID=210409 RepID=A0A5B7JDZ7_PORTR|nr:hypothetical protein [Portunus trituberculatus]
MVLPKTCSVCLVPLSVTGEAGTKSPPVMNAAVEVKCQGIVRSEAAAGNDSVFRDSRRDVRVSGKR